MPPPEIYLLVGCPGSGKTWVCSQLGDAYHVVPRDAVPDRNNENYLRDIAREAKSATKPLIVEAPFSVSDILHPLRELGHRVTPMFILEDPLVVSTRYLKREGRPIPQTHLTRQDTYRRRAAELDAFSGTSAEVVARLKEGMK